MILIPIHRGRGKLNRRVITFSPVSDIDAKWASQWAWSLQTGGGYAVRGQAVGGRPRVIYLHREILKRKLRRELGRWDITDHKDRNPLNNRRGNIRLATSGQNTANGSIRGVVKFKGVCVFRGGYQAQIRHRGSNVFLGHYKNPIDADRAYDAAAILVHGKFAHLNFGASK